MKHKLTGRLNEVNCVVVAAKLYCVTAKQKNKHDGHRPWDNCWIDRRESTTFIR